MTEMQTTKAPAPSPLLQSSLREWATPWIPKLDNFSASDALTGVLAEDCRRAGHGRK